MPVEILQKPVSNQILINIVEETEIYDELKKFKIDVSAFKNAGFRHESLKKMLNVLGERKTDEEVFTHGRFLSIYGQVPG